MGAPSTKATSHPLLLLLLLLFCFCGSPVAEAAVSCTKTYTIVSGDISQSYGITVSYLQSLNPGIVCDNLQIGQVICVSGSTTVSCTKQYTIVSGNTCWAISQSYGITVSYLQSLNSGIVCDNLQIGQVICVSGSVTPSTTPSSPPPPPATTTVSCTKKYTIVSGDTCWAISQSYGITVSYLQSLNPSIVCDNLQIGQVICVSGSSTPSTTPSPSPPPPATTNGNGKFFGEYIGANWNGVKLSKIPINSSAVVHALLAFAIDYTSDTKSPANGKFSAYWDTGNINEAAVKSFKSTNPNVKMFVSLGGDSIYVDASTSNKVQFKPTSVSFWVSNAVSSITSIAQTYHLDGIDIDYEHFDYTTASDFASAICQLITSLKQAGVISLASIAPFSDTNAPYIAVWNKCPSQIDYVNYQFYELGTSTTVSQYVAYYKTAASKYPGAKVLTSFLTEASSAYNTVTPSVVLQASQQLHAAKSLPGIFVWSADGPYASSVGFTYEKQAQIIVTSP